MAQPTRSQLVSPGARKELRRRGPLSSAHFSLSRRPRGAALASPLGDAPAVLLMAVPKRLLKRALDRNTLRRVAREAWREQTRISIASGMSPDQSRPLLRLLRRPEGFENMSHRVRKQLWRREIDVLLRLLNNGHASPAAAAQTIAPVRNA